MDKYPHTTKLLKNITVLLLMHYSALSEGKHKASDPFSLYVLNFITINLIETLKMIQANDIFFW